jgi:hypothetical protein
VTVGAWVVELDEGVDDAEDADDEGLGRWVAEGFGFGFDDVCAGCGLVVATPAPVRLAVRLGVAGTDGSSGSSCGVTVGTELSVDAAIDTASDGSPVMTGGAGVNVNDVRGATRATVVGWAALLAAALITATVATDAAMRTPLPATTVAMILERSTVSSDGSGPRPAVPTDETVRADGEGPRQERVRRR